MDETQEEKPFAPEEVNGLIKESIEATIQNSVYHHTKSAQWNSNIVEACLKKLTSLGRPFKYVVTCAVMQRNGAGLHSASACYWDNNTDGYTTYKYESKTMYVVVNVYGVTI